MLIRNTRVSTLLEILDRVCRADFSHPIRLTVSTLLEILGELLLEVDRVIQQNRVSTLLEILGMATSR